MAGAEEDVASVLLDPEIARLLEQRKERLLCGGDPAFVKAAPSLPESKGREAHAAAGGAMSAGAGLAAAAAAAASSSRVKACVTASYKGAGKGSQQLRGAFPEVDYWGRGGGATSSSCAAAAAAALPKVRWSPAAAANAAAGGGAYSPATGLSWPAGGAGSARPGPYGVQQPAPWPRPASVSPALLQPKAFSPCGGIGGGMLSPGIPLGLQRGATPPPTIGAGGGACGGCCWSGQGMTIFPTRPSFLEARKQLELQRQQQALAMKRGGPNVLSTSAVVMDEEQAKKFQEALKKGGAA